MGDYPNQLNKVKRREVSRAEELITKDNLIIAKFKEFKGFN
jgi:hypothetical protein